VAHGPACDRRLHGGSPSHPDWYYNLKANPRIKVELGTQTFTVFAEELEPHRPRRAVAEAGRGVAFTRRIRDQDHATDSVARAHPRIASIYQR
jgi:F420H(2)-dependent quinone reductase